VFLGVFLAFVAVSLASMFGSPDGASGVQAVGNLLAGPLVDLFHGGIATAGAGVALMVVSSLTLLVWT
jgi:hypothetical protein